jgi:hypothetical protein
MIASIVSPRLIRVGAGAVGQIAEVLAIFGLSRPLVVSDPQHRARTLAAYVEMYIREEIRAEALGLATRSGGDGAVARLARVLKSGGLRDRQAAVAALGRLPDPGATARLVELGDLRGAFHNHTTASDGRNTLTEMAAAADALGWDYLGIADHSKSSRQANGLSEERLARQIDEIRALNESHRFKVRNFSG